LGRGPGTQYRYASVRADRAALAPSLGTRRS
jgi:hypothetical protein